MDFTFKQSTSETLGLSQGKSFTVAVEKRFFLQQKKNIVISESDESHHSYNTTTTFINRRNTTADGNIFHDAKICDFKSP